MPICPRCHDTYRDGVAQCVDCHIDLLADDAPLPARVDRLLGTFDPTIADHLTGVLSMRGIPHRLVDIEGMTEVIVDRDEADELRAELMVSWDSMLASLEPEDRAQLPKSALRGWIDAPRDAWIDRHGELRVQADREVSATNDAQRLWGPTLLVLGGLMALYGWYTGGLAALVLLGISTATVGLFLPR